jgi:5-formyltetrahydrofolate cyclo-ligase
VEAQHNKSDLRGRLARACAAMPAEQQRQGAVDIAGHIAALPAFIQAQVIGIYCALSDEVDLAPLAEIAWAQRKTVCCPRITRRTDRQLVFIPITNLADLVSGPHGVREPCGKPMASAAITCLCIPGRAFDAQGHRLGRGAGYYDRWLARSSATRIGVAFQCQLVAEVPHEIHDQMMDVIVTETGAVTPSGSEAHDESSGR